MSQIAMLLRRFTAAPRPRDVRQGEMAECGLAALASLMSVYGVVVPLDRLRELAASTLYGTSLRTLREIAMHLGFEIKARRVEEVAELSGMTPCLVHLDFIHFAVVEQVTAREVVLTDPLAGAIRMPVARFSRAFTGVALTLRPTPFLRKNEAPPVPSRWAFLPALAGPLVVAIGSGAALGTAAIAAGARFDHGGDLVLPVAALAAAVLLSELAMRSATRAQSRRAQIEQDASIDLVAGQPAASFVLRSPVQPTAMLGAPAALIDPLLIEALLAGATGVTLLLAALIAAPMLALCGGATIGLEAAACAAWTLRRGAAVPHLRRQPMPVRTPYADELARADGWGLGGGNAVFQRMAGTHAAAAASAVAGAERGAGLAAIRAGGAGARLLILLLAGAALVRGDAGALLAAGVLVMMAGRQVGYVAAGLRAPDVTAALHRLADRGTAEWGKAPGSPAAGMALEFEHVAWRAAEMLPDVVSDVSFAIPRTGSLAIMGPPRSGATTTARLAAGWLSPSRGEVRSGSAILLGTRWLHGSGRLRDLLAIDGVFGDAEMLELLNALDLGDAFAARGGLDLKLSEGAPEVSGGQRRRLMLAAALLREPELLVLDGTLDAIATESAAAILAVCKRRGTAVLLAGHRDDLSSLCDARYRLGAA